MSIFNQFRYIHNYGVLIRINFQGLTKNVSEFLMVWKNDLDRTRVWETSFRALILEKHFAYEWRHKGDSVTAICEILQEPQNNFFNDCFWKKFIERWTTKTERNRKNCNLFLINVWSKEDYKNIRTRRC